MAVHLLRGMAAGMLAGCAASWAMNQFRQLRPQNSPPGGEREQPEERQSVRQALHEEEEDATVKTAQRISQRVFHHDLSDNEKQIAGPVVHYGYGSLVGAMYGGLAELLPAVSAGAGLPFGFALWLLGDEVAVPALGLAKPPTEYPPSTHADALAAHFAYGFTTDLLRRVLRHVV